MWFEHMTFRLRVGRSDQTELILHEKKQVTMPLEKQHCHLWERRCYEKQTSKGSHLTVVKHQILWRIADFRTATKSIGDVLFTISSHNCKYFLKPTFICVHIGQDGIIVLDLYVCLRATKVIVVRSMNVIFYLCSLCKFLTSFLNLSLNEAFKLSTKSTLEISKLDLDCSGGIYLEVTFSPGNNFIST